MTFDELDRETLLRLLQPGEKACDQVVEEARRAMVDAERAVLQVVVRALRDGLAVSALKKPSVREAYAALVQAHFALCVSMIGRRQTRRKRGKNATR